MACSVLPTTLQNITCMAEHSARGRHEGSKDCGRLGNKALSLSLEPYVVDMDTSPSLDSDDSSPQTQSKPLHNSLYYFDCLVFLVEGVLFKVPRHHFNKSTLFETIFTLPPGENLVEGSSDEHPFELHGIKNGDFECLMKVMYPIKPSYPHMNRAAWISVLKLSTMWELDEARATAIQQLSKVKMLAVDRVLIAREFNVPKWLLEGYIELVKQEDRLSIEDATRLGWETATRLFRVREICSTAAHMPRKAGSSRDSSRDITTALQAEFPTQLEDIEISSASGTSDDHVVF